jgi:hypothetical protein
MCPRDMPFALSSATSEVEFCKIAQPFNERPYMSNATAISNNATKLSISTPSEMDLVLLVREVAETKSTCGVTLRGKHGDQSLFSGVCKSVKSRLGIAKEERLPEETANKVNEAIAIFWRQQLEKVIGYGEVQTVTFDKPSAEYDDAGNVSDIKKNARVHVSASVPDSKERKFFTLTLLNSAKKRLVMMKDRPSVYDRDDYAKQENKIAALEKELVRLNPSEQQQQS